jgi:hypothetical protein
MVLSFQISSQNRNKEKNEIFIIFQSHYALTIAYDQYARAGRGFDRNRLSPLPTRTHFFF